MYDVLVILFLASLVGFIMSFKAAKRVVFWSKNKTKRNGLIVYGIATAVFLFSAGATAPPSTPASAPLVNSGNLSSTPHNTTGNTAASKPTPPTPPPTPPTLQVVAQNAVHDAIPKSNLTKNGDAFLGFMDDKGVLIVQVEAEDNLTHGLIKNGILIDAQKIMQDMFKDKRVKDVRLVFYFPITDSYGNSTNAVAEKIEFSRQTADRINWDNFLFSNIPNVADDFEVNPAFDSGN